MNRHPLLLLLLAGLLSLLVASSSCPLAYSEGLTVEKLKNAEYRSWKYGKVKLKDGQASNLPEDTVMLSEKPNAIVFGDLNGDGVEDAAVILWSYVGASGCAVQLVAMINKNGVPRQVGTRLLGDSVGVNSLSIRSGVIVVDLTKHRPDDAHCCPSLRVTERYRLKCGNLVPVP
jgi:hypothetical protein